MAFFVAVVVGFFFVSFFFFFFGGGGRGCYVLFKKGFVGFFLFCFVLFCFFSPFLMENL